MLFIITSLLCTELFHMNYLIHRDYFSSSRLGAFWGWRWMPAPLLKLTTTNTQSWILPDPSSLLRETAQSTQVPLTLLSKLWSQTQSSLGLQIMWYGRNQWVGSSWKVISEEERVRIGPWRIRGGNVCGNETEDTLVGKYFLEEKIRSRG